MFDIKSLLIKHVGVSFESDEINSEGQNQATTALFALEESKWEALPFELQCFAHDALACQESGEDALINIKEYTPQLVLEVQDLEGLKEPGYVFEVAFKGETPTAPVQGIFLRILDGKELVLDIEGKTFSFPSDSIDEIVLVSRETPKQEPKVKSSKSSESIQKAKPSPKAQPAPAIKPPRRSALSEMKIFMLRNGLSATKDQVRNHLESENLPLSQSTFDMCFNDMRATLKIIEWLAKGDI